MLATLIDVQTVPASPPPGEQQLSLEHRSTLVASSPHPKWRCSDEAKQVVVSEKDHDVDVATLDA
jgi:hypothetical protein